MTPAAAPNNVYTSLAAASGTAVDAESGIVGVGVVLSRRAAGTTPAAVWNWRLNQWSLGVATGPDFVKLAESFSVGATRVTSPDAFRPALERALADGGPYLIDIEVPTDSEASPWTFIRRQKP